MINQPKYSAEVVAEKSQENGRPINAENIYIIQKHSNRLGIWDNKILTTKNGARAKVKIVDKHLRETGETILLCPQTFRVLTTGEIKEINKNNAALRFQAAQNVKFKLQNK